MTPGLTCPGSISSIKNCERILTEGVRDDDLPVRPHWEDGTPAHTIKLFGVVNRYDLQKEFPIMTLRRTYWKSAIDELLWIWQKKSLPRAICPGRSYYQVICPLSLLPADYLAYYLAYYLS